MDALSVRDCGAVGDGRTGDTAAIQAAIDRVAADGGGRVTVPSGLYLTGTLYLRDAIELHLERGATLIGSPRPEDYNRDDYVPEAGPMPKESVSAAHLIIGIGLRDVAITGAGTIRGNSDAFMAPTQFGTELEGYRYGKPKRAIGPWRPAQMVFLLRCSDVTVTGVQLLDATYWTMLLLDCDRVKLSQLTITNPADTQNGDGIDVVSCRNVTISDCIIRSGDDCLVFRTWGPLGRDRICSDIVVTNCTLSAPTSAVRVGVADGLVRRVMMSNCVISHCRTGVLIVARYSDSVESGTTIEQLHFRDLVMDVAVPFSIVAGLSPTRRPAAIRDVSIVGCEITATAAAQIVGSTEVPIERLTVRDTNWRICGGSDNDTFIDELPNRVHGPGFGGFPGYDGGPTLPAALWATHTESLVLDNIEFHWESPSRGWRDAVEINHSKELRLNSVRAPGPIEHSQSSIRLNDVTLRM